MYNTDVKNRISMILQMLVIFDFIMDIWFLKAYKSLFNLEQLMLWAVQ
jgi:hypothetical protein